MIKIEIPVSEAVEAFSALSGIGGNASVDMSWAIDDIKDALRKHKKRHDEKNQELLEEFGEKNSLGHYMVSKDKIQTYRDKLKELGEIKVSIEFEPLDYDIVLSQGIQIPISSANALRPFIVKQKIVKPKKEEKEERKLQAHKKPKPIEVSAEEAVPASEEKV